MATPDPIDRRSFLIGAVRRRRAIALSCERLYVRYLDARAADRVDEFSREVEQAILTAGAITLTDREWLSRDDFRIVMESILRNCEERDAGMAERRILVSSCERCR